MKSTNGMFDKIVDEATEKVAQQGWRNATQKEITLASFGMLSRLIRTEIGTLKKPFWAAAGVIGAGVCAYIITSFLG